MPKSRSKAIVFSGASKRPANPEVHVLKAEQVKEPKPTMGLIKGMQPGSEYEWNTALALWSLNWDFLYQVDLAGGRDLAGGLVLDFLVKTEPAWTAMPVNGPHWHSPKIDEYMLRQLVPDLIREGYTVRPEPVIIGKEAADPESCKAKILMEIGRN